MAPAVVLVGPPGAGKSTVARALGQALGCDAVDSDEVIEAEAGMSIADLFVTEGEPAFRAREVEVIARELQSATGILSLGGGSVLDARTRARLAGHMVVWLQVDLAEAAARVGLNTARPLLLGNVRQTLGRLMQERDPLYSEVATLAIDTTGRRPDEIAADISTALAARA